DAVSHLWNRLRQAGTARILSQADRRGREARSPQGRPRDGSVSFSGRGAGSGVLAFQRMDAVPAPRELHPASPERGRLSRGELAAAHGFVALGRFGSYGKISRADVPHGVSR